MNKFFKYGYWSVVVVIAIYYILFNSLRADSALPAPEPSLSVNAIAFPHKDVSIEKQYVGYVVPVQSVEMAANVSGYIDEVMVTGGERVKTGDNLVLIDQREYKAELEAAQANTAKAKADYDNALNYYKRLSKAGRKAISATESDNAKAAWLTAQATLQQAKALEQKAKTVFDYTIIQAPIDGIVGNIDLTKGNYITPNSRLFNIVQFDPIRVVFAMSDKDFLQYENQTLAGERIMLRLANGKLYEHAGHFKYCDNMADKSTNSVSLYADFANPDRKLLANSYVDVFIVKELKDETLVRQNYAQIKEDGIWAYVAKDDHISSVKLDVDGIVDNFYAVANKFADNEYLVVDNIGATAPTGKIKINLQKTSEK